MAIMGTMKTSRSISYRVPNLLLTLVIWATTASGDITQQLRVVYDDAWENIIRLEHVRIQHGEATVISQLPFSLSSEFELRDGPNDHVDREGHIHGVFYTLDRRNERAFHGTLYYVTDRSGELKIHTLLHQPKGNRDTHYRNPQIRVPPGTDRPLVVFQYTENVQTGSWSLSHLKSLEQQANGSWRELVIANQDDGYRGTDGGGYTGEQMSFELTPQGQPVVLFADMASYHAVRSDLGFSVAFYFSGQMRLARWSEGGWSVVKLYSQSAPSRFTESTLVNEIHEMRFSYDENGQMAAIGKPMVSRGYPNDIVSEGDYLSFFVASASAPAVPRWKPHGWAFFMGPYAYVIQDSSWYYFSLEDTTWRVNLASGLWSKLAQAAGWNYYAWPYGYAIDTNAWYWHTNDEPAWVLNLQSGVWSILGQ
jgi:hypothetical protein